MALDIVNGYVCRNCTDIDLAKRFIDPAQPPDGADGATKPQRATHPSRSTLSGNSGIDPAQATLPLIAVDQPLEVGDRGTTVNILA